MVTHPGTNHEQRCFFGDPLGTGTFNVLGIAAGGYDQNWRKICTVSDCGRNQPNSKQKED